MMKTEKEKMLAGELYVYDSPELQADTQRTIAWMARYNAPYPYTREERHAMLGELFAEVGEGVNIRAPFYCDYGANIHIGKNAFINFNCVVLDSVTVIIGEMTQIGPNVQILGADHPRDPALRRQGFEFGRPVKIGNNVWIGAGAMILPGVTVEDDAIIGAGSVVTRDVPKGATVVGNPARILEKKK